MLQGSSHVTGLSYGVTRMIRYIDAESCFVSLLNGDPGLINPWLINWGVSRIPQEPWFPSENGNPPQIINPGFINPGLTLHWFYEIRVVRTKMRIESRRVQCEI